MSGEDGAREAGRQVRRLSQGVTLYFPVSRYFPADGCRFIEERLNDDIIEKNKTCLYHCG